jgi:hypothetical protein
VSREDASIAALHEVSLQVALSFAESGESLLHERLNATTAPTGGEA